MTVSLLSADRLLTPKEAAKLLAVSTTTIRRYIRAGFLPCWRRGPQSHARLLLDPAAVEALLRVRQQ